MLEHLPRFIGHALAAVRAGADRVAIASLRPGECREVALGSSAFGQGGRIPERFTADGAGVSPPLQWGALPEGTAALALLVEDADSPSPNPLVHAVVWDLDLAANSLAEGAIGGSGDGHTGGKGQAGGDGDMADDQPEIGRNSYFQRGWLPPDPPPGHGEHHYVFQLFALSSAPHLERSPGRSALLDELDGRLLGVGILTGTYSRDDPADIGPIGAISPA